MEIADKAKERTIYSLKRTEGQIRGIQKMISESRDCIDVLNQVDAAIGALSRIEDNILHNLIRPCIEDILKEKKRAEREEKLIELLELIRRLRKI
ncbi:MAG: metal-sensing transcriptional repressor [Candidatus Omnitrophica bacterium]|nr:metal-sensing transcriptional repressor [Candidatus Omnitrophota bacterium]MBD3269209.1 metal-sensing transcriptional repressor [Candidatus Omnitrophota bacterium]